MPPVVNKSEERPFRNCDSLIVIGASAGGPRALRQVLPHLPADLPAAVVVVQHMPAAFTPAMAHRFDEISSLIVHEAQPDEHLACGKVLIAPGDFHLRFSNRKKVTLDQEPRHHGVRPAVDITMESAAKQIGKAVIGVVLTGMGTDGTTGARAIKAAGGRIIAEDQSTCLVYGMPRSVIQAGVADKIAPLAEVVPTLLEWIE
jgi:two-component system, chemotaxis family, protein-glutamate methylesterase/glutaminase